MNTDNQLLAEYADRGSEGAFRELVQRHINMVHCAALREARGNVALAEDITQEVFTQFARRAKKLSSHPALAGWLYTCVRQITANIRRAEDRRQRREHEAFLMNELLGPNQDNQLWQQVRPVLDDVMHELDDEDRTAVVLRFFEGLSLKEVGVALGLTENAARMRVERSLEKLHVRLSRRGINSTASTLAGVLVAGAVLSASSTFAASVATGAMASAAAGHASAFSLAKALSIVKSKTVLVGSIAILASGIILWKHFEPHSNSGAAKMPAQSTAPAMDSMDANNGAQAEPTPVVVSAAPTNAAVPAQMALQLLDTDTGEPLPGAKLYLFYMFKDGRGKAFHTVTDGHGRAGVDVPQPPYWALNMFVTADGHVPKVTTFGFRRAMPSEYSMKLERGVSIGGVVLDESGRPISNAKVGFNGPGNDSSLAENIQFGPDTEVVTDANGQWSCNMIPRSYEEISVHVKDGEHAETNRIVRLATADANKLVIRMTPGFSVKCLVEDLNGNPIPGARVRQVQLNDEHDHSKPTDASGAFEFKAMAAGELIISVQADGFAPAMQTLQLSSNVDTFKFQLGPGQLLRGRIVDEESNPVTNAFVEITRGQEKILWNTNTDASGRFEWNSAPVETLHYSVLAEGFNRVYAQTLSADGSEQVIKLTREHSEKDNVQITGTAVDADTGKPLDTLKVFVGEVDPLWEYPLDFYTTGKDGQFAVSFPRKSSHPGYIIEIEQEGYLPAASPVFQKTNGNQKLQFKLQKGTGPAGVVKLPNGEPAVNATVCLCTSRAGVVMDGPAHIETGINTTSYKTQTDSSGKFTLAAATDPQGLIIVHDQGYAEVSAGDLANIGTIRLQPWGTVKGKLMAGSQPGVANEPVAIFNQVLGYADDGRHFGFFSFRFNTATDSDGNFIFDKVPPGQCAVAHEPRTANSSYASDNTAVTAVAGNVSEVVIGGPGRTIVGKAILSGSAGPIDWRKVPVSLHSKSSNEPNSRPKREDFSTFEAFVAASENYFHIYQNQKRFETFCGSDGSFQVSDVPAGTYELRIEVRDTKPNSVASNDNSSSKPVLDSLVREIVIPDDNSVEAFELGPLEMTPQQVNVSAR